MTSSDRAVAGASKARLVNITRHYGALTVVDNVNLEIHVGEFLTLLGPSGSGKTTLLQMLAGLTLPSSGKIEIDGSDVTNVPPYRRDIGVVFQSYALFPHMSVAENVAFPLAMRHVPRAERIDRVREMLRLVKLHDFADRMPGALSGGQQQRVALARALVFNPSILLMDEPLGALDRNLRQSMQAEILRIHDTLGVTTVYVTHDQDEALSMSDRVAIVKDGRIAQLDTAAGLYERPLSPFIAKFLGESNVLTGVLGQSGTGWVLQSAFSGEDRALPIQGAPPGLSLGDAAHVCVRPERIALSASEPDMVSRQIFKGEIESATYYGAFTLYHVRVGPQQVLIVQEPNLRRGSKRAVRSRVFVSWDNESCVALTTDARTAN